MSTRTKKVLIAYLLYTKLHKKKKRKRKMWVHPILLERESYGAFHTLFEELKKDETKFFNFFRMTQTSFLKLLEIVHNKLQRADTNLSIYLSITPAERLAVTIRYLASGSTFTDLQYTFRIGIKTISYIVREVCTTIWSELSEIRVYMKLPSKEEWLIIAKNFESAANFPLCLGAVDGKHIRVIKPEESGSMFLNYKHYFSVVLMAVVDSNYNYIFIDVGAYGKDCDSAVFKETEFWKSLLNNRLNIPESTNKLGTECELPYVFVADEAFALNEHLLRPFGGHQLDEVKRTFNYRLTRARRYVECAFGIMANKWRILHRPLNVSTDLAVDIVKTCCLLQNFIHKEEGILNMTSDDSSTSDTNSDLRDIPRSNSVRGSLTANMIRNKFAEYFITPEGETTVAESICLI